MRANAEVEAEADRKHLKLQKSLGPASHPVYGGSDTVRINGMLLLFSEMLNWNET